MNDYCNDSCRQMAESRADSGNSTGYHASGVEAPATSKSPHIDELSSLKVIAADVEFHDLTAQKAVLPNTKCDKIGSFSPPHYFI